MRTAGFIVAVGIGLYLTLGAFCARGGVKCELHEASLGVDLLKIIFALFGVVILGAMVAGALVFASASRLRGAALGSVPVILAAAVLNRPRGLTVGGRA